VRSRPLCEKGKNAMIRRQENSGGNLDLRRGGEKKANHLVKRKGGPKKVKTHKFYDKKLSRTYGRGH